MGWWGLALPWLLWLSGCAAGPYGRIVRDAGVSALFENQQLPKNYRYYFSGPEGRPSAIMGLASGYELAGTQWTAFDASGPKLKKWVDWFDQAYGMRTQYYPSGFRIEDPSGKQIGIWYSIWDWTVVSILSGNRVMVFPPNEKELNSDPGDVRGLFER
jgi:hypothetical protein